METARTTTTTTTTTTITTTIITTTTSRSRVFSSLIETGGGATSARRLLRPPNVSHPVCSRPSRPRLFAESTVVGHVRRRITRGAGNTRMLLYTLIGGYMLTSMILFKYPTLLHKKKRVKFLCQHISHRGGAGESYENTMCAFRRAVSIGTQMLELDCHLTKDGEVVVSHDQNLLRSTGIDKNICELDYKDLPLLKQRLPIDFDPDVEYIGSAKEEDRRFALLREVFEAFPHIPINIDIKINDDRLISKISDLIKEYKREEYTVWGNFSDEVTQKCYKMNPSVNLLFSMQRVTILIILMYTGLLPFVPLKETHLEIFLPSIYLRRKGGPSPTFLPLEKLVVRTINILLMRPCLFNHLRARGIHVYFWVLNKDEEFKKAFELGATGVMTDYPTKLKLYLKNHEME